MDSRIQIQKEKELIRLANAKGGGGGGLFRGVFSVGYINLTCKLDFKGLEFLPESHKVSVG